MKAHKLELEGCWLLEPTVLEDDRGYFFESFNTETFKTLTGVSFEVKQINQSRSQRGVLRGMHFQSGDKAQAKLISCVEGELIDVAIDLRKNSPTFKKYYLTTLSASNKRQLYIPRGFAHGFLVISDLAKLVYLVDELYSRDHDTGIIFNDPEIGIKWDFPLSEMKLSDKDKNLPTISESKHLFP